MYLNVELEFALLSIDYIKVSQPTPWRLISKFFETIANQSIHYLASPGLTLFDRGIQIDTEKYLSLIFVGQQKQSYDNTLIILSKKPISRIIFAKKEKS